MIFHYLHMENFRWVYHVCIRGNSFFLSSLFCTVIQSNGLQGCADVLHKDTSTNEIDTGCYWKTCDLVLHTSRRTVSVCWNASVLVDLFFCPVYQRWLWLCICDRREWDYQRPWYIHTSFEHHILHCSNNMLKHTTRWRHECMIDVCNNLLPWH